VKTIETNTKKTAVFDFLTNLAHDPFAQDAYANDPDAALARAGLSGNDLRQSGVVPAKDEIAGGPWASCQTCSDPGPDPFPEGAGEGPSR
jgi:hypothetical protein